MEINTQERGAWTSASSAQADQLCPGRHLAQKGIEETKSEDAQFGTAIHEALAKQDPTGLTPDQVDVYDACNEIEKAVLIKYFGPEIAGLTMKPIREQRFWINWADGLKHSGQIDAAHRKGTKALIVEYKTLSGDVAGSPRNLQLRDQVCLFNINTELLSEIAVAVIQPLATHTPELCIYSAEDIRKASAQLYLRVKNSNNPDSNRVAGEVQCKYCKAIKVCDAYNKWAGSNVPAMLSILDVPIASWSPEQRALFCERMPIAQKWLDECKDEMKQLLDKDPEAIPGWELKPGATRETITDAQGVFDRFSKKGGSLDGFMGCISVTKTKLKTALAAATKSKGKALEKELTELTAGLVSVSQNEPSLKRKE